MSTVKKQQMRSISCDQIRVYCYCTMYIYLSNRSKCKRCWGMGWNISLFNSIPSSLGEPISSAWLLQVCTTPWFPARKLSWLLLVLCRTSLIPYTTTAYSSHTQQVDYAGAYTGRYTYTQGYTGVYTYSTPVRQWRCTGTQLTHVIVCPVAYRLYGRLRLQSKSSAPDVSGFSKKCSAH